MDKEALRNLISTDRVNSVDPKGFDGSDLLTLASYGKITAAMVEQVPVEDLLIPVEVSALQNEDAAVLLSLGDPIEPLLYLLAAFDLAPVASPVMIQRLRPHLARVRELYRVAGDLSDNPSPDQLRARMAWLASLE